MQSPPSCWPLAPEWQSVEYFALGHYLTHALAYVEPLRQLKPDQTYYGHPAAAAIIFVALLGGIIASLGFMWAVRHPKKK